MSYALAAPLAPALAEPDPRATRFLGILLLASAATVGIFPLILPWGTYPQTGGIVGVLTALSTAHVGMTGYLWTDPRYRARIATRPVFFYVLPALGAAVAVGSVLAFGLFGSQLFASAFQAWLMYHFAKQNWGMLSLSAGALRADRPLRFERWLNLTASAGGAIGLAAPVYGELLRGLWQLGLAITCAVAVCSVVLIVARMRARAHPLHLAMMALVGLFFLPLYLFGSTLGVMIVGQIHALQYMGIMMLMAHDGRGNPELRTGILVATAAALIGINTVLYHSAFWGSYWLEASVLVSAIQVWHFIVDADVWRLSQPFQRNTLKESLPFLFR